MNDSEHYLQAKFVVENPDGYHEGDVSAARNYVNGYEDAMVKQKEILIEFYRLLESKGEFVNSAGWAEFWVNKFLKMKEQQK